MDHQDNILDFMPVPKAFLELAVPAVAGSTATFEL